MVSWLVRAVGAVAPGMALRLLANQARLRSYIAAGKSGPNKGWMPTTKTADAILTQDRAMITARARDLVRNSSHVAGAIEKIINNVIYTGIHPQAQIRTAKGQLNERRTDHLEDHFERWAEAVGLYELQALALRHELIDGECLILLTLDDDLKAQGLCPLRPELLEADYLDASQDTGNAATANRSENRIKGGIEFDRRGLPVAYHILDQHPGDTSTYATASRRIEAEWIVHLFRKDRASQTRGVSRLASIVMEMRDFAEYQSSERIASRLAAAFGIFVESPYPEHQFAHPVLDTATQEAATDAIPKYLESGRIDVLPPGMKISVAENKRPGSNYDAFSRTSLRGASAGVGLSYETFSNDYSSATYSSARAATLEERRGYRSMQAHLNRRINGPIWAAFCYHLSVSGIMPLSTPVPVIWQNPGWPWVDPAKDGKAAELELALGITTRRKLAAERGMDWDEVIQELAAEETKKKALGLTLGQTGGTNETADPDQGDDDAPVDQ